jgi:hypothetical protein
VGRPIQMRALAAIVVLGCSTGSQPSPPIEEHAPELVRDSIAVGDQQACAIDATGAVACWGVGAPGRFGTPTYDDDSTPVRLPGIAGAAGVAAGSRGGCAWTVRGEVLCWTDELNDNYALRRQPFQIAGLTDIVQVTTSSMAACGLHASGRVSCWDFDRNPLLAHVRDIAGLSDVVEIAGVDGGFYNELCARQKSGAVTCVDDGKLVVAADLAGATSIAGAFNRIAALLPGHRLVTWTANKQDGLIRLDGVDGERVVVGFAPTDSLFDARACVIGGAATRCWMLPYHGKPSEEPVRPAARDLALDNDVMCLRIGEQARCSGTVGQLGDGTPLHDAAFVQVHGLADATQLEAAGRTTCALRASGRVACWGQQLAPRGWRVIGIDRDPVELPGVSDAVELAMVGDIGNLGDHDDWAIACARRSHGATCWSTNHGVLEAHDAPELAAADKLYSGREICGVSAHGAVRCTHFATDQICTSGGDTAGVTCESSGNTEHHELEAALHRALKRGRPLPQGMRAASDKANPAPLGDVDETVTPDGDVASTRRPPAPLTDEAGSPRAIAYRDKRHQLAPSFSPPISTLHHVAQLRTIEWVGRDDSVGVLCARQDDGRVACWGERDYLGAGEHGTRSDLVAVSGLVMGPPRPVAPRASPPTAPPKQPPPSPPTMLAPQAMHGPYRDVMHACAASRCPNHETQTYCREIADQRPQTDPDAMAKPPAPFSRVELVAFDCRSPNADDADDLHRMRIMVTRADGVWLSEPVFVIGKPGEPCNAYWHADWQAHADNPTLSVVAGKSCLGDTGGIDDAVALTIVVADGKQPVTYPAIPTATSRAIGCVPTGAVACQPSATTVQLTPTFTADGLALAGPASWPAPVRDAHGTILGVGDTAEPSAIGWYRFTPAGH